MMARPIQYIDDPNVVLPLAASYNQRGALGFTQAFVNSADQRKVNSIYEPITNALSGKQTLYLSKRPGVSVSTNYGVANSSATAYLIEQKPSGTTGSEWLFNLQNTTTQVTNGTTTVPILNSTGYVPMYVDKTAISGIDNIVLQIGNGAAVSSNRIFYASSIAAWTEISSATITSLALQGKMEHIDGYALIAARGPNRIYSSDLNSLDSWQPNAFIARRAQQDVATGLAKFNSQILFFGAATFEVYQNAGTAFGNPLESITGAVFNVGLPSLGAQRPYYAINDGWLYWVSINPIGVHAYNGARVEKVSNIAIDKFIKERYSASLSYVSRSSVRGQNAIIIGNAAAASAAQFALVYFPHWKEWFEWDSSVFIPLSGTRLPSIFLGSLGGGTASTASQFTYTFDPTSPGWRDNGVDYTMTHQFKMPTNGNSHRQLRMFGVKADTAASNTTSVLNVRFTNDDWQTSTAARSIDLTKAKKHIYRCGAYSDLGVYLDHTGNLDCRIEQVIAKVE